MEKDIEYRIKRFLDECEDGNWYWDDGVDAIENLIKGYKELEEQIDKHVYFETTNPKEIEKNYIPKSKIKEKIEELKNENYQISLGSEIAFDSEIFKNNLKIQVLQELMEE